MAITTSFNDVKAKFNAANWTIDEFEEYYLARISETMADTNYYTDKYGVERKIGFVDHHPELKNYEVWVSGYAATGESATASLLGKALARNFAQACDIVMCNNHLEWIKKVNDPEYKQYNPPSTWCYDPQRLTDWGRGLYWSEELARKFFG